MTRPHVNLVRNVPLPTSAELVTHLQSRLEPAVTRQLWVALLDKDDCPLPTLVPVDVDAEPSLDLADGLAEMLYCLSLDFPGASLVLTLERPGPAEVVDRDRRWMRALHGAALGSSAKFRGPFLLLADGIHELDPLDYIGIPWVYSDDGEHPDYDDESDDAERDDHADGDDDQGFGRPA
jgi:hypothetical protein